MEQNNISSTFSFENTVSTTYLLLNIIYAIFNYSSLYVLVVFWPIGVVMNLFIVLVFAKWQIGISKTTTVYYVTIASSELMALLIKDGLFFLVGNGIFVAGIRKVNPQVERLWSNELLCNFLYMFWFISEGMANQTYLAFSVERVIAIYKPFHAMRLSRSRALAGVLLLLLFNVLLYTLVPVFRLVRVQPNAYLVDGIGCYGGGVQNYYSLFFAPLMLVVSYVVPPYVSIVMNVLIIFKIRKLVDTRKGQRHLVPNVQPVHRSDFGACVTLVIVSCLHALFFLPMATFRIVAVLFSRLLIQDQIDVTLWNGIGLLLFVLVIPSRLTNFIVYWFRVKNFSFKCCKICFCGLCVPRAHVQPTLNTFEIAYRHYEIH